MLGPQPVGEMPEHLDQGRLDVEIGRRPGLFVDTCGERGRGQIGFGFKSTVNGWAADTGGVGDEGDGHAGVTQLGEQSGCHVEDRSVNCGVAGATLMWVG